MLAAMNCATPIRLVCSSIAQDFHVSTLLPCCLKGRGGIDMPSLAYHSSLGEAAHRTVQWHLLFRRTAVAEVWWRMRNEATSVAMTSGKTVAQSSCGGKVARGLSGGG